MCIAERFYGQLDASLCEKPAQTGSSPRVTPDKVGDPVQQVTSHLWADLFSRELIYFVLISVKNLPSGRAQNHQHCN